MGRERSNSLLDLSATGICPGLVDCLGQSFPSEEARREQYLRLLNGRLKAPDFCQAEGFPIGDEKDILAVSDPPYFTACPNPFLGEVIRHYGRPFDPGEPYSCEPFASDVAAGKNDTIYMAHSYHTKVPHQAILRYILHYTKPGDIILDGFCGSGMTGVAATLCSEASQELRASVEREMPGVHWGRRIAILNDLSPAAAFIAYNYNARVDPEAFLNEAEELLARIEEECGHLYRTAHSGDQRRLLSDGDRLQGLLNYAVWSEVMTCPQCGRQVVFFDHAVDTGADPMAVREEFPCPQCNVRLTKRSLETFKETAYDPLLKRNVQRVRRVPVFLKYMVGTRHFTKKPDPADLKLLATVHLDQEPAVAAHLEMPTGGLSEGNAAEGMTHLHHYYTPRNFLTLSRMIAAANGPHRRQLFNLIQSISVRLCSFLTTYQLGKRGNVPMTGTLYVGSLLAEANPIKSLEGKLQDFAKVYQSLRQWNFVGCGSSSQLASIPDSSIDYIFIDPPFGDNLNYAQLNMLWEGWLRLRTNVASEAIVDRFTSRDLAFYQEKLRECLAEFRRVLKPGRWMTVEFHNSKNAVWNAIQAAILEAGFVIADVRTLDKKQGTPKQVNSLNAVKQDLVISAYKPTEAFEKQFSLQAGTPEGVWRFIEGHLRQLPVFVAKAGRGEAVAERQKHLLFDRMIAFHVQRGITVPISASAFYAGLQERYPERDGMFFLPEQVAEYDRRRLDVAEVEQVELFVTDERSAIRWVRRQLVSKPMNFQELQPLYMKEARLAWEKYEAPAELRRILEESFIQGEEGRWRVPDPNKEADLEQLRHRALLKEFREYQEAKGKLKVVRSEALRAGFKECWQRKDFTTIVQMAKRVPEAVIQEDQALLMYLDNALLMTDE
jgi:DNA modification methylase